MPALPAQSVDAIITDLPYGTTQCEWDSIIPLAPMWKQVKRVLKADGVFATTAAQPFASFLIVSNPKMYRYEIIWEKNTGTRFLDVSYRPLNYHENIEIFYSQVGTFNPQMWKGSPNHASKATGRNKTANLWRDGIYRTATDTSGLKFPRTVITFDTVAPTEIEHPTQKPVSLYEYLIRTYTNPGETVLDIAMGSGTTIVAAIQTGRNAIGIEKDKRYFEIAVKRAGKAHPPLFTESSKPSNNRLQPTAHGVGTQADNPLQGSLFADDSSATHGGG